MKLPRVAWASCQKAEAAIGSPSMGARITFTGTLRGSRRSAC